jgi:hypothetical protein
MQSPWILSSTILPDTNASVEFTVEEREQSICGTFAHGVFHSRWADYDARRVPSWRGSDTDRSAAPIHLPPPSRKGALKSTLKKLTRLFSRTVIDSSIVPARNHFRTTARHATDLPPIAATTRGFDSNQISS